MQNPKYPEVRREDGHLFFAVIDDRVSIATTIERLIDYLDLVEGDADFEDVDAGFADGDEDEPSLSAEESVNQRFWGLSSAFDDHDLEDDTEINEPMLGALERHVSVYIVSGAFLCGSTVYRDGSGDQTVWGHGSVSKAADELEEENENGGDVLDQPHDGNDEGNDEPDLGWAEDRPDQSRPYVHSAQGCHDGEWEEADDYMFMNQHLVGMPSPADRINALSV